ncbi:MAG: carbon storage regulator [Pirellulales bacterium]
MLILSRKVGERITIGEGIEIVVQRVAGERVTIGINAPSDVKILRGELVADGFDVIVPEKASEKLAPKVRHHDRTRAAAPALASQGLTNRVRSLKNVPVTH